MAPARSTRAASAPRGKSARILNKKKSTEAPLLKATRKTTVRRRPSTSIKETQQQLVVRPPTPNQDQESLTVGTLTLRPTSLPGDYSLAAIAEAISKNTRLFGDEETTSYINNLSFNCKPYDLAKKTIEARFFRLLDGLPEFTYLAEEKDDPEYPPDMNRKTRVFYILLRGAYHPLKKNVLNKTLLIFSHSFIMKDYQDADLSDPETLAKAQYEPGSVDTYLRQLFSVFSSNGIIYRKDKDFNERGDFQAYWKDTFAKTQKYRHDYGTLPNAATFDENFLVKRARAILSGVLDPLNNFEHHTWVLVEEFIFHNILRGSQEPTSILISDIEEGVMPSGSDFAGRRFYKLSANHAGQKMNGITLQNKVVKNNRNKDAYLPMIEDPDDPFCLFNLLDRHLKLYLPPDIPDGRLFRREAFQWQKDVRYRVVFQCNRLYSVVSLLELLFFFFIYRNGWRRIPTARGRLALEELKSLVVTTQRIASSGWLNC